MVHNGIEYGDMQLIAEAAHLCRELGGLDASAVAVLLGKLNAGPLDSFLMETTAAVHDKADTEVDGKALVRPPRRLSPRSTTRLDSVAADTPPPAAAAWPC